MRRDAQSAIEKRAATQADKDNFKVEYLDGLQLPSSHPNPLAVYSGDKLADFVGDGKIFAPDTNIQILMLGGADADYNYQQLRWPNEMAEVHRVLQQMMPTARILFHSYIKIGEQEEEATHLRRDTSRGKMLVQYDPQFNVVVHTNDQGENVGFSQLAAYRIWFEHR